MSARVRRSWSEGRAGTAARSPGPTRDKELESGSYGRERRRACRETRSGARSSSVGESTFQSELPSRQAVTLPVGNSCSGHEALRREGAEAHRAWAAAGRRTRVLPLAAKKKKKRVLGATAGPAWPAVLVPGSDEALIIHLLATGRGSGAPAPSFGQAPAASGGGSAPRFLPAPPQLGTRGPLTRRIHRSSEARSARPDAPLSPAARTPGDPLRPTGNFAVPPTHLPNRLVPPGKT